MEARSPVRAPLQRARGGMTHGVWTKGMAVDGGSSSWIWILWKERPTGFTATLDWVWKKEEKPSYAIVSFSHDCMSWWTWWPTRGVCVDEMKVSHTREAAIACGGWYLSRREQMITRRCPLLQKDECLSLQPLRGKRSPEWTAAWSSPAQRPFTTSRNLKRAETVNLTCLIYIALGTVASGLHPSPSQRTHLSFSLLKFKLGRSFAWSSLSICWVERSFLSP